MKKMFLFGIFVLATSVHTGYAMQGEEEVGPYTGPTTLSEAAYGSLLDMMKELKQVDPKIYDYLIIEGRLQIAQMIADMNRQGARLSVDDLRDPAYYRNLRDRFYRDNNLARHQALIDRWRQTYLTLIELLFTENQMNPEKWALGLNGYMTIGGKQFFEGEPQVMSMEIE